MPTELEKRADTLTNEINRHIKEIEFAAYLANRTMDAELEQLWWGGTDIPDAPHEPSKSDIDSAFTAALQAEMDKPVTGYFCDALSMTENGELCGQHARYHITALDKYLCETHWDTCPEHVRLAFDGHIEDMAAKRDDPAEYQPNEDDGDTMLLPPDEPNMSDETDMHDTLRERDDPDA